MDLLPLVVLSNKYIVAGSIHLICGALTVIRSIICLFIDNIRSIYLLSFVESTATLATRSLCRCTTGTRTAPRKHGPVCHLVFRTFPVIVNLVNACNAFQPSASGFFVSQQRTTEDHKQNPLTVSECCRSSVTLLSAQQQRAGLSL